MNPIGWPYGAAPGRVRGRGGRARRASPGPRRRCTSPSPRCPRASPGSRPSSASQLFHRVGRRAVVSAAGEAFLEPARQLLRDRAVLTTSVAAVVGLEAGRLDLVALPTLAVEPLSPLVGEFRRAHPGDRRAHRAARGRAAVATQRAQRPVRDRAGGAARSTTPGCVSEPLLVQELVVVLPPSSPLVGRRRLTLRRPRRGATRDDPARDPDAPAHRRGVRRRRRGRDARGRDRAPRSASSPWSSRARARASSPHRSPTPPGRPARSPWRSRPGCAARSAWSGAAARCRPRPGRSSTSHGRTSDAITR